MSFFQNTQRIIRSGFSSFWRNKFITVSAILIMTVTLMVLGGLLFLGSMLDSTLVQIEEKVDVNVYFTPDATENEILAVQSALENREDIVEVGYVSEEEALSDFRRENRDDEITIQALEEFDDNPLGAHLNIQAQSSSDYEGIATYLQSDAPVIAESQSIIDQINYQQNKDAIDKLTGIIQSINTFSFIVMIIFAVIASLIVFNTIRLAIFASSDEISVMELMGASRSYIRGPFVIEGIMYGIVSALLALLIFYPLSLWGADATANLFGGSGSFTYYLDNFGELFVILTLSGIALGGISSYIAVRKYLDL